MILPVEAQRDVNHVAFRGADKNVFVVVDGSVISRATDFVKKLI